MPYELREEPQAARGSAIWRWFSSGLVVLLVVLIAYLGYVGWVGSGQAVQPPAPSRDCRTPALAFGWTYEVINYDPSADRALESVGDAIECPIPLPPAGDQLVTSDGVSLAGWYIPAATGIGETGPTIVLAHDYGMNKSTMLATAALLHDDYNLVLFDFRNHGQSEASPTTIGFLERLDVLAVIDWLEAFKAPTSIGILGVSMGGSAAVNEAAADPRVLALALDSTHATLANAIRARLEGEGYPLALPGAWAVLFGGLLRTGQDMSAADPVQVAARLGERPLLVIAAGSNEVSGASDAEAIAEAGRRAGSPVELETCAAATHAAPVEACADSYRDWVLGFFGSALEPES